MLKHVLHTVITMLYMVNIHMSPLSYKCCFLLQETLTGFKWMGSKTAELQAQGKRVLFAYEEAIGFMCGTAVLDKDGISAGIRVAEMAAFLSSKGMSMRDKLDELVST
jgi:phosphoglucomutase/phosphopentomutase